MNDVPDYQNYSEEQLQDTLAPLAANDFPPTSRRCAAKPCGAPINRRSLELNRLPLLICLRREAARLRSAVVLAVVLAGLWLAFLAACCGFGFWPRV